MFEDITRICKMAKDAYKLDPTVINATMGVLHDDNGQVIYSKVFDEMIDTLVPQEKYPYDNVAGPDSINNNILNFLEQTELFPEEHFSIVTAGGTGSLSCMMNLFNDDGGLVTTNLCWGNYLLIAKQNNLEVFGYNMFKNGLYDYDSFEEQLKACMNKHKNTIILLNTPSHNPTGYDMSREELDKIVEIVNRNVTDDKHIAFMLDIAYYNYGISKDFSSFNHLNKDVTFSLVYSFSKSLGIYGLRLGTLTVRGNNLAELKARSMSFARATWSSPNKMACSIVEKIILSKENKESILEEIEYQKYVLKNRSSTMLNILEQHNIKPCPYKNGFFITIEVHDPEAVARYLFERKIYVTTISNAIRVAISGIPTNRIEEIGNQIVEAIKNTK